MASDPYVTAKFKVWAVVSTDTGDIRFDDIVSVSATFALNSIPTASLIVAVGYNPISKEYATIHSAKAKMQPRDRVVVKLTVTEGVGDTSKLKAGTYTIFDGYFVGIGYQRSSNHANYVLNITHWLDDLNNSSAINGNWFPGVPYDYAQNAAATRLGTTTTGIGAAPAITRAFTTRTNITTDLWGKVIKPLFVKVAGFSGGLVEAADTNLQTNAAAKAALDRMPGVEALGKGYYKPLKFQLKDGGGMNLEGSFAAYFTQTLGTSFAHNSFWSKLITEYAAQFLFAVSPAVKWALPIPFCAGLRWREGGKIISADEYNYASFNSNMSQMIESVTITYPVTSPTNLGSPISPPPNAAQIGYYRPYTTYPDPRETPNTETAKQRRRGLRLFKLTPTWAAQTSPGPTTANYSGTDAVPAVAPANPQKNLPPAGASGAQVVPGTTASAAVRGTIDRFAQQWFITEVLQQRYGELSGPLRFDIAPGSVVKIATPARDRILERAPDNPAEYVVASIMSVSYVINAERATAGTSFAIAHTKTEYEATLSNYSVVAPPLYTATQPGDPDDGWHDGPLADPE
jgi:hypothetical protein